MISKRTKFITIVGVMSALAFILYYLEFPISFLFPPFLKIDFSDVPAILAGIAGGPIVGIAVEFIKNLLHLLIISKEPAASGEIANFCAGVSFMLPVLAILRSSSKFSAIPYIAGSVVGTIVINIVNYFVTLPLYGMTAPAQRFGFIFSAGIPFNLTKWIMVSIVVAVLYNRIQAPIRKLALR